MRRERAMTPGETVDAQMAAERRAARREALADLLASDGWQQVLRPGLLRQAQQMANTLALGETRSPEEMRVIQGRYRALVAVANVTVEDLDGILSENS